MIPAEFDYQRVGSVDEAIAALGEGGEDAKLLAGGHSLVPLMKLRLAAPTLLIDIGGVEELKGVQRANGDREHRRAHHPRDAAVQRGAGPRGGRGVPDRRPAGAQPRHDRRLARPRRPGVGSARR